MIRTLIVDDHPAMRAGLTGCSVLEIAATLGVEPVEIGRRFDRMIKRLKVEIPAPCAAR